MNTVTVNASTTYEVKISSGLLPKLGAEVSALGKAGKVCIVSDSNVWPLYGNAAKNSLENAGLEVISGNLYQASSEPPQPMNTRQNSSSSASLA